MISTVHAVLPEYGEDEMRILEEHIRKASAITVSWPHPLKNLIARYPSIRSRAYLVPYTASHLISTLERHEDVANKIEIPESYFFYASAVYTRKNHRSLVEACCIHKNMGISMPIILCTGGGDLVLQNELEKTIKDLAVSDRIKFIGHVEPCMMSQLYKNCLGTISASLWEAGNAPLHEGAVFGKPHACARIDPTVEHVNLLGVEVCYFDPDLPEDIALKLIEFGRNIEMYKKMMIPAIAMVQAIDRNYMGYCYLEVMKHVCGFSDIPSWYPFLDPIELSLREHSGGIAVVDGTSSGLTDY
jgi:glycosyltransferase involved in cell wall biosynthesis